jgi:hypothetical protein
MWQSLNAKEVSQMIIFSRMLVYAAQAALILASDRPRARATNLFSNLV